MEVHHYDYYPVANALHRAAAGQLAGSRLMRAASGASSSAAPALTAGLPYREEAAA
jgi:hypothetical protein